MDKVKIEILIEQILRNERLVRSQIVARVDAAFKELETKHSELEHAVRPPKDSIQPAKQDESKHNLEIQDLLEKSDLALKGALVVLENANGMMDTTKALTARVKDLLELKRSIDNEPEVTAENISELDDAFESSLAASGHLVGKQSERAATRITRRHTN